MQRVLLISADDASTAAVEHVARAEGRELRVEPLLDTGLQAAREWRPHVVLLDLGLGVSAGELLATVRDPTFAEGVPLLAIAHPVQFSLVGPGVEVHDVLVAPLDLDELRLRLARAFWHATGADDSQRIQRGGLTIDLERYQVSVDGEVVDLTYKEYELLCFLASNEGKPFTREALLNRVWGYDYYGGSRTVDVHIRRIRAKIERNDRYIDTVRNVGYRFIEFGPGGRPTRAASDGDDDDDASDAGGADDDITNFGLGDTSG